MLAHFLLIFQRISIKKKCRAVSWLLITQRCLIEGIIKAGHGTMRTKIIAFSFIANNYLLRFKIVADFTLLFCYCFWCFLYRLCHQLCILNVSRMLIQFFRGIFMRLIFLVKVFWRNGFNFNWPFEKTNLVNKQKQGTWLYIQIWK